MCGHFFLQVSAQREEEWAAACAALAPEFTFSSLTGEARDVFNMFIQ